MRCSLTSAQYNTIRGSPACCCRYSQSERVDVVRGGSAASGNYGNDGDGDGDDDDDDDMLRAISFEWDAVRGVAMAHTELATALGLLDSRDNQANHLYGIRGPLCFVVCCR